MQRVKILAVVAALLVLIDVVANDGSAIRNLAGWGIKAARDVVWIVDETIGSFFGR